MNTASDNSDNDAPIIPKPGMPATICYWTDRDPCTISRVSESGRTVWVKHDKWKVVRGSESNGSAEYFYEPDSNGKEEKFTKRKNGRWVRVGENERTGTGLALGYRQRYLDPHF